MDLLKRIQQEWKGFSSTKKSVSLVIIACLILSTYFFYRWATKVEYATLFTNVQTDNAGKIVEGLKGMSVPYQLADEGKTILVPKDQVYEVRLSLASKGVTSEGGAGFELFDTSNLGATDFERNVNYQRALQEELRRSIVQIDAVKQARVHLVLPEKSAFIENQSKPQASIVLELKPLVQLQPEQVKGIAELVAGAVENLSYADVNIIDTEGHVLSDSIKSNGNSQLELSQLEMKKTFEESLQKRIQQLLESIYGPNKIVTMVTANLDFNQKETNSIVWGKEGVVASEQLTQKTTGTTDNSVPVGDPNRTSTVTTTQGTNNADTDMSSTKNYEINKLEEKEIYAPGRLISLSVAVAINGNLSSTKEASIKKEIAAAIGFNSSRGDTINVLSTKFDQTSLEADKTAMAKADAAAQKQEQMAQWESWGSKGIGILAFLILGFLLVRYLKPKDNWPELNLQQPMSVKNVEEQMQRMEQNSAFMSEDEKIKKILKNEPEIAVQIITSWLEDSGGDVSG